MRAHRTSAFAALMSIILLTGVALAQARSPATNASAPPNPAAQILTAAARQPSAPASQQGILAVVVRSWSGCGSVAVIWNSLNENWPNYGSIPIRINYSYRPVCNGPVTYQALVDSGADVMIISNPAGGGKQYSVDEIAAIQQYANEGHDVVGSYLVLAFPEGNIDNSGLATVFGLDPNVGYTAVDAPVDPTYRLMDRPIPLFRNLSSPYHSLGYEYSQRPADNVWSGNELLGARYVATNRLRDSTILVYRAASYVATYITNMPEYFGGKDDKQFYYNAITLGETQ